MTGLWKQYRGQISVAAVAILLVTGIISMMKRDLEHHRADVRAAAYRDAGNLAKVMESHILATVTDIDRTLKFLRAEWLISPVRFLSAARHLHEAGGNDLVLQVGVIAPDGRLAMANSVETPQSIDLSDRDHFRFHRDTARDQLFISKPVIGRVSGKWSIQFTRRISGGDGEFLGVVGVSVDPEYFSKHFDAVDLG